MAAVRELASMGAGTDDDVRRYLHDTVLQSLELIAGGAVGSPADLADAQRLARRAADTLREWLDGAAAEAAGTLGHAVREVANEAREFAPHRIEVVVGRDDAVLDDTAVIGLAGALREVLTNARKHAQATRVVVFCEDVGGRGAVSVRDDGVGAEPAVLLSGRGVAESIVRRIEDIGGSVQISAASPGVMIAMNVPAEVTA